MVKKTNIPQALLRYVHMDESELHDIMEKNPYYTLPKIAYMLKTHQGIEKDDLELYVYDISAIKELLSLHLEHLDDKVAERKNDLEKNKIQNFSVIPTNSNENLTSKIVSNPIEFSLDKIEITESNTLKSNKVESKEEINLLESNDDMIMFDMDSHDVVISNSSNTIEPVSTEILDLTEPISFSDTADDLVENSTNLQNNPSNEEVHIALANEKNNDPQLQDQLNLETQQKNNQESEFSSEHQSKKNAQEDKNQLTNQMDFFSWLNSTQINEEEKKNTDFNSIDTEELEEVVQDPFFQNQIHSKEQKSDLSIEEKAKISIKKSNLISETLAKLYTDQGETKKAKEMYLKLIEKFPEKSTYFASLIKKLNY